MSDDKERRDDASLETPPIDLLEKAVADMFDGKNVGAAFWDSTLRDFRKALDAARRENVWEVVDVAFGSIISVSFEMFIRSQLAMRLRTEAFTQRRGGDYLPDVPEDVERVERSARFLLEAAERYAKVRHVTHLARRRDDPKMLYFDEEKEKIAARKSPGERGAKKAKGAEA